MRIFDCHSHWGTKKGYLFRTEAELARQEKIWKTPVHYYTEDEQAEYFRSNNARAILDISWIKSLPMNEMRQYHDYVFAEQRKHSDVYFGQWLQFDPVKGVADAVREFERCISLKAGFVGLCINGQVTGVPASDPTWDPFYKASIDAGAPVMILCGLTGVGQGLPGGKGIILDNGHPRHIDAVAARFPELKVLAARPAYPWQDEMIAILIHKPNVSYELHGWGPKQFAPALKREIGRRLQDRVMFGCDFPVLKYEKVTADWRAEGYTEEVLEKVFCKNAEAYFPCAKV
jgi:predicted TIM-barrel fold metal-dependent hydrolase